MNKGKLRGKIVRFVKIDIQHFVNFGLHYCRNDFVSYAKTCGSVKDYVDKIDREHHQSTSRPVTANLDKASAAFKAIDKDNSGYVDREEFLQFTK